MNKISDFSIHFTIKDQPLKRINELYEKMVATFDRAPNVLNPLVIMHHCFLPEWIVAEKQLPTDLIEFLDSITRHQVRWFQTSKHLHEARALMMMNLQRLGGTAIFLGEIRDGVESEYSIAKSLGIEIFSVR